MNPFMAKLLFQQNLFWALIIDRGKIDLEAFVPFYYAAVSKCFQYFFKHYVQLFSPFIRILVLYMYGFYLFLCCCFSLVIAQL